MKKILFALLIILVSDSFCSVQLPSAQAEEAKTFVGTVKRFASTNPLWYGGDVWSKIDAESANGDNVTFIIFKDTAIYDIGDRKIDHIKRNQKAEIKYSLITAGNNMTNGKNRAISIRYVPADYAQQIVSSPGPTAQSGNTVIGRIDLVLPFPPSFRTNSNCMIRVVPDNGGQYMYFKLKEAAITDLDGKPLLVKSLNKGERVEVKYSDIIGTGFSGAKTAKAISMRYVASDYVPQPAAQTASVQAVQGTSSQSGDTFVGTIESFPCGVGHFKSGPPLWPAGMIVVTGNNGEKNNFLIVMEGQNATAFYDADGKAVLVMSNPKAVIGKRVEVKYAVTAESMRYANKQLAISVRYVSQDYVPQPGISAETGKPDNPAPQSSGQAGVNLFTGTIEYASHLSLHIPPGRTIRLSSDKGDKLTVFVSNDIAIRDMNAAPTRIGKRAEVKYSPAANGDNEAISFRYLD